MSAGAHPTDKAGSPAAPSAASSSHNDRVMRARTQALLEQWWRTQRSDATRAARLAGMLEALGDAGWQALCDIHCTLPPLKRAVEKWCAVKGLALPAPTSCHSAPPITEARASAGAPKPRDAYVPPHDELQRIVAGTPVAAADATTSPTTIITYPTIPEEFAGVAPPMSVEETRAQLYFAVQRKSFLAGAKKSTPPVFDPRFALSIIAHKRSGSALFDVRADFLREHWKAIVDAALAFVPPENPVPAPVALPTTPAKAAAPAVAATPELTHEERSARRRAVIKEADEPGGIASVALQGLLEDYGALGDAWMSELKRFACDDPSVKDAMRILNHSMAEQMFAMKTYNSFVSKGLVDFGTYLHVGLAFAHHDSTGQERGLLDACLRKRIWECSDHDDRSSRIVGDFQTLAHDDPRYSVLGMLFDLERAGIYGGHEFRDDDISREHNARLLAHAEDSLRRSVHEKVEAAIWYTPLLAWVVDRLDVRNFHPDGTGTEGRDVARGEGGAVETMSAPASSPQSSGNDGSRAHLDSLTSAPPLPASAELFIHAGMGCAPLQTFAVPRIVGSMRGR